MKTKIQALTDRLIRALTNPIESRRIIGQARSVMRVRMIKLAAVETFDNLEFDRQFRREFKSNLITAPIAVTWELNRLPMLNVPPIVLTASKVL